VLDVLDYFLINENRELYDVTVLLFSYIQLAPDLAEELHAIVMRLLDMIDELEIHNNESEFVDYSRYLEYIFAEDDFDVDYCRYLEYIIAKDDFDGEDLDFFTACPLPLGNAPLYGKFDLDFSIFEKYDLDRALAELELDEEDLEEFCSDHVDTDSNSLFVIFPDLKPAYYDRYGLYLPTYFDYDTPYGRGDDGEFRGIPLPLNPDELFIFNNNDTVEEFDALEEFSYNLYLPDVLIVLVELLCDLLDDLNLYILSVLDFFLDPSFDLWSYN